MAARRSTRLLLAMAPGQKLFDKIIDGHLMAGALAFAAEVADKRPLPLVRNLKDWSQIFSQFGLGAAAIQTLRN